jgi:carboxymethylenebutenolidase
MPSDEGLQQHEELAIIDGIPSPLAKWAEESYTVVSIKEAALRANPEDMIKSAVSALESYKKCDPKGDYGLIGRVLLQYLSSLPLICII